ncbi:MAG: MFS transporter [Lentisphaeria bacterium]|nr:MFS transporter [Lentisphaeria bacterium]
MICQNPLTPEQIKLSQRNYLAFGAVNGASYMCLGETVIILFAVRLESPNTLVAILGSMLYFGFLLLPLGKWMTSRVGAAQSQADFWFMRNIAAMVVALSAPAYLYWNKLSAMILLVTGAFFFYGFRAAGVVMSQPLLGEICEPERRGRIISLHNTLFHISGLASLVALTLVLKYFSSIWALFGVIVVGAVMGTVAAGLVRNICETGLIKDSAKLPIAPMLLKAFSDKPVRRQLLAGAVCNLMQILVLPISVLTVKKGYHFSDTQALFCTLLQFTVMIGGSFLQSRLADWMGARNVFISGYAGLPLICISWLLLPSDAHPLLLGIPFIFCGLASITITNGTAFYFLATVKKELQVAASMLISVATGVLSGLAGMLSGSLLLKTAEKLSVNFGVDLFRSYFAMVLFLTLAGFFCIWMLPRTSRVK